MARAAARFGIVLLPETLTGWGDLCREVEDAGFEWLGVADSQSVFREMYVALTVAALHTRRVRLGPLVTNPLTRHLVVTASAIASVDELSGGRAVLGLGSGDSAIYTIGAIFGAMACSFRRCSRLSLRPNPSVPRVTSRDGSHGESRSGTDFM